MTFHDVRTGLIDWAIERLKKDFVYIALLVMGYIIFNQEKERRQQTQETLLSVREDRKAWRTIALQCQGIDTSKIAYSTTLWNLSKKNY